MGVFHCQEMESLLTRLGGKHETNIDKIETNSDEREINSDKRETKATSIKQIATSIKQTVARMKRIGTNMKKQMATKSPFENISRPRAYMRDTND